jgi:EAL domain-containing protein (putative c-di-GMP-specific phosphodiesterase class I)
VAISVEGRGSAESLLQEADRAMYHAKAGGGDDAEVFDEVLGLRVQQRSVTRRMIEAALSDGRVVAHYQPIIDLRTGGVVGFEALARITAVDGSLISPDAFIPGAEESGLIIPLDRHVLDLACRAIRDWAPPGIQPSVAVNMSARQFERGDLPEILRAELESTGLDPISLHLELTETAILDLRPDLLAQLGRITDLGIQVGLDDFGTGHASLTHLCRMPLTFVKIDQTFVQGLETGGNDERVVSAVIDLAANLGLRSIAEGVESTEQAERLRQLGCDEAQGYLFARPVTMSEVSSAMQGTAWA